MIDLYELESRHKKYTLKKRAPYASVIILVVAVGLFMLVPYNSEKVVVEPIKQEIAPKEASQEMTKQEIVQIVADEPSKNQAQVLLTPSLGFLEHIDEYTPKPMPKPILSKPTLLEEPEIAKEEQIKQEQAKQEMLSQETLPQEAPKEEPKITITKTDERQNLSSVIERFKNSNNPALSLFVAKKYYQLEEWESAYDYALITNNIKNDIEDSWLIFAKSQVKLGKKDDAAQTLKRYISHSNSQAAKQLLGDIHSGKFR